MESTRTTLTVGQVAERFGITVRTLHHYDDIGLLCPSDRSSSGYRLYTDDDLTRLANIVVYRRLEFSLEEIALLLEDPESVEQHLRRQRLAVTRKVSEMNDLVEAIDRALEREMNDRPATADDLKALFGEGFDDARAEAEERWGDSDAWQESQRRSASYSKADWEVIKAEQDALIEGYVAAMDSGSPPTSEQAMDAAEAQRQNMTARFYDCSPEMHRSLGDLYMSDERFTQTYDEIRPGLTLFVRDAIHANADRVEG